MLQPLNIPGVTSYAWNNNNSTLVNVNTNEVVNHIVLGPADNNFDGYVVQEDNGMERHLQLSYIKSLI